MYLTTKVVYFLPLAPLVLWPQLCVPSRTKKPPFRLISCVQASPTSISVRDGDLHAAPLSLPPYLPPLPTPRRLLACPSTDTQYVHGMVEDLNNPGVLSKSATVKGRRQLSVMRRSMMEGMAFMSGDSVVVVDMPQPPTSPADVGDLGERPSTVTCVEDELGCPNIQSGRCRCATMSLRVVYVNE